KVVATIEMPTSHQGAARPDVKNSVVLEPARRQKNRAGMNEMAMLAPMIDQSRVVKWKGISYGWFNKNRTAEGAENGDRTTKGCRGTAEDQERTTEGAEVAEEHQNIRTAEQQNFRSSFLSFFLSFFLSRLELKEIELKIINSYG